MISTFRGYLNTWIVRGFFLVLVAAFALWGIGDVIKMVGSETWVAKVGGRTVEPAELQDAFHAMLARYTRANPGTEPSPPVRRQIADQALQQLVLRIVLDDEVQRLRVLVPDAELRQSVFDIPAFHGATGRFDRQVFEALLRNNNLTEPRFLALQRDDLARRQVLEAVRAGVAMPDVMVRQAFDYRGERRAADMVEFPFATVSPPAPPADPVLTRWYENHPWLYSSPEFRRVKVVILAPQTVGRDIQVSEDDLRAAYQGHLDQYVTPPQRSVQVILANDQAQAQALAAKWRAGADWASMQDAAKAAGATAVELDKTVEQGLPVAELARAVFAAQPGSVADPVHSPLGWHVFRVIDETQGTTRSFEQVKDEIRDRLVAERAGDVIYDRANKLDNLLASGASLDEIPTDIGAAAVAGTLDAQGNTTEGQPAPIPGSPELRNAIIAAAFQTQKGDAPHLTEVPPAPGQGGGSAYYAMTVEEIVPPALRPFDDVRAQVLQDWTKNEVRRAQDAAAAKLLTAINGGQSIADAALVAGATVRRSPLADRATPVEGMPEMLQRVIFGMKQGEATQVETPDGFVVAVLTDIKTPDPQQDAALYDELRRALTQETANDAEQIFVTALRDRQAPRINPTLLDQVARP